LKEQYSNSGNAAGQSENPYERQTDSVPIAAVHCLFLKTRDSAENAMSINPAASPHADTAERSD
jgi:hypothetical protein